MADPIVVVCDQDGGLTGDLDAPPVPWWSVGKTCIAAGVLALVGRGRLALDDRWAGRAYTLRQLLQHTSGLGSYTYRAEYTAAIERKEFPWTDDELLARVRLDPFVFAPGEGWSYSNTGYFLLRRLIEQTMQQDIEAALRELVFAPLGIHETRIARSPGDLGSCAWGNARLYHPLWVYQGLLVGPATEAATFMHRLLRGDLLPSSLQTAMQERRDLDVEPPPPWRMAGYGLGLMMGTADDVGRLLGHSGQGPGSVAAVYHFPDIAKPCTATAFAACEEVAMVERLAIEAAVAGVPEHS